MPSARAASRGRNARDEGFEGIVISRGPMLVGGARNVCRIASNPLAATIPGNPLRVKKAAALGNQRREVV
jgi:hypothetical protein